MTSWQTQLSNSITRPDRLPAGLIDDPAPLLAVCDRYPMRITPYYLGLIRHRGDPIWRQCVPDPAELADSTCFIDPLGEEDRSPVPGLIHKYPDRVLFLAHARCAVYCRFCTRKRKVGTAGMAITPDTIAACLDYIRRTPQISDVLLSGGDPLLLSDDRLADLLGRLRAIPHVEIIRIGSRVPCTLPQRVTVRLAAMLKKFHPLYLNTHFNHPDEITREAATACGRLANAGIPLGCQTVLLRGVNDEAAVIRRLMRRLLAIRVKPYYLFQADMTRGTDHFRTPVERGLAIMRALIGFTSGLAVPAFALDAPGGGGKLRMLPDYGISLGTQLRFRNYLGEFCTYQNPAETAMMDAPAASRPPDEGNDP
ncbi:MAG: KamA family radical SAM protein [Thermodesulfobacteriota bacterium]